MNYQTNCTDMQDVQSDVRVDEVDAQNDVQVDMQPVSDSQIPFTVWSRVWEPYKTYNAVNIRRSSDITKKIHNLQRQGPSMSVQNDIKILSSFYKLSIGSPIDNYTFSLITPEIVKMCGDLK